MSVGNDARVVSSDGLRSGGLGFISGCLQRLFPRHCFRGGYEAHQAFGVHVKEALQHKLLRVG
jgi:hypothetical protein